MVRKAGRSHASLLTGMFRAIAVPILALGIVPGSYAATNPGNVVALAKAVVGSQPQLVRLSAATRIGESPPEGWNHVVLKSVPRPASGEWHELPQVANHTATLFRTAILADVQPLGLDKVFVLSRIGLGMCVPARDGRKDDIVVTSDRVEALGLQLSSIEQMVLEAAETELAESRIIASTSTFALLRSPVTMLVSGKHRKVELYYAFCVDPSTGRLRVGVWSMWPGGVKQPPPPAVVELAPRTMFDCELDVQAKRVLGTVPYSWSFAIRKLPAGHAIPLKGRKALNEKIVAIAKHPSDVDTAEFERMLRAILFAPENVDKAAQSRKTAAARRTPSR
jgi:hypothetical protein